MGISKASANAVTPATKGALAVGSGTNTASILSVGSNGDTLVADSSATTGLRWTAVGLANPVINGAMDIWQRGTSIAGTTTSFSADRWQSYRAVAGSTFSRQNVSDSTNLPSIQYCARIQRNSGNTATDTIYFWQNFETTNSIPFAGKTITLSFYARRGANYSHSGNSLNVSVKTGTGTDQNSLTAAYTGAADALTGTPTLTTTWQRFSYSGTVNSTVTEMAVGISFNPTGTAGADDWFEITGVQIDVGSVALPFRRSGGTIAGELAACQRYFYRAANGANKPIGNTNADTTNLSLCILRFPVSMRGTPTMSDSNGTNHFFWRGWDGGNYSTITFNTFTALEYASNEAASFYRSGIVNVGTAASGRFFTNNASSFLDFSAEL